MTERYLPDGRRFYGKTEIDEIPDWELPCPACGQPWESHAGGVEIKMIGGQAGFVMPHCEPSRGSPA
jgi:hypothetical protein